MAESVPEDADRDTVLGFVQAIPVPEQPAWVARLMGYLGGLDFPAGLCPTPAQLATACRDYSGPPNPIHFRAYVLRLLKPGRALDGAAGPRRSQSATGQAQLDAGRDWARRKQAEAAVQEATRA